MKVNLTKKEIDRAISNIHRRTDDWYDYCSSVGHIPGNVAHMPSVQKDFALYLKEEGN